MNINSVNSYNQNFEAKFKMSPADQKLLKKAATVATGASMIGYGAWSLGTLLAPDHLNFMVESLPDGLVKSHEGALTSATENGLPAQSTMAPETLSTFGAGFMQDGLSGDDSPKIFFS